MFKLIHHRSISLNSFFSFIKRIFGVIDAHPIEDEQLKGFEAPVRETFNLFGLALNNLQGNVLTEKISEADRERDRDFLCLRNMITAYTYHYDEDKSIAARLIIKYIRIHGWSMHRMNYAEESGAMRSLIMEIYNNPELKGAFETISQMQRVTQMETSLNRFDELNNERIASKAQQPEENASELAKPLYEQLNDLVQYIQLMAKLKPNSTYAEMMKAIITINEEIDSQVKARKTRKENEKEEQEDN